MSVRSGLAAQLGAANESTYGTRVAANHFYEFSEEDMSLDQSRVQASGISGSDGGASSVERSDRFALGKRKAGGKVTFSPKGDAPTGVMTKSFGLWFEHIVGGAPAITTPGGGTLTRDHAYTTGDPYGLSLTVQIGRPDVSGTIRVHEFEGCKVLAAEFNQEIDQWLGLEVELDAEDETTSQTLATASYTASREIFHWGQCGFQIGGGSVDILSLKWRVENPLKTDRHRIGSSLLAKQPVLNGRRMITGEVEIEYGGLTEYNRYINGTVASAIATWTSTTAIEGALFPRLILTGNNCRWDKPSGPNVKGPDLVTFTAPFKCLYDGSAEPFQIDYRTTDTAV